MSGGIDDGYSQEDVIDNEQYDDGGSSSNACVWRNSNNRDGYAISTTWLYWYKTRYAKNKT